MSTSKPVTKSMAELLGLSIDQLCADFRRQFVLPGAKALTRSKMIVAMDLKREGKESMRAFMKREFGEVDANAYKPARVFRDLVAVDSAGAPLAQVSSTKISESTFDSLSSIRVHIESSAILGYLEDRRESEAAVADRMQEDLCRILSSQLETGEMLKQLALLKDLAKPEKKEGEGDGGAEGEGEAESPLTLERLTPYQLIMLLHGEKSKPIWRAIAEGAKEDPSQAAEIAEALASVAANASKVGALVSTFIPLPAEAAA